jgi:ribonuclease P protein component
LAEASAGLAPRERLRTAAQFQRVFREGRRLDGPLFLLIAAPNEVGFVRLGLAAGRRLGAAAARNRAKRRLREAFRRSKPALAHDLVLVPKREILVTSAADVEREYRQRLERLASGVGARVRPRPAPRD